MMTTIHGGNDADIINGTDLADLIFGNGGNDWLSGRGGNDTIRGGAGQDIIEGGEGNDILFADSNGGGREEDVLFGGADSDILVSGSGRDHFNGGTGIDAASWQESAFAVSANLATGRATSGSIEDTFTGIENLIGSRFADTLRGNTEDNGLFAGDGNDTLYGGAGSDELSGGAGNDLLYGGDGINSIRGGAGLDTVDYSGLKSGIQVYDMRQVTSTYQFETLAEVEVLIGTRFADDIEGNAFGNRLSGGVGNDTIDGGEGNDLLTGGSGADTFEFYARSASRLTAGSESGFDRISDFDRVEGDRIDLTYHKEATNFATLRAEASQFGADTHLRLGEDTIVLEEVGLSDLRANMFLF